MSEPTKEQPQPQGAKGAVGLRNLGNTCYANAAIQALRNVTEMTYLCVVENSDLKKTKENHSGKLFEAYRDLIRTMWGASHPAYVSPDAFWRDMLEAAVKAGHEEFQGRQQQDAHEFLSFLLDQIFEGTKEEVNFIIQRPPPTNALEKRIVSALESWKQHFEKQYTPIVDIWFGLLEYQTECQQCMNKSFRYETFNSLKITVPYQNLDPSNPPNIYDMLKADWEPETIEGYACDHCKPARTVAKRQVKIWRIPRCLMVVLKRFTPDGRKINTNWSFDPSQPVSFSEFFSEASPERSKNFKYTLQSVVDHHGSTYGGHYTAQGLSPVDSKWYLYDDETTYNIEKPMIGASNYVLVFRANS